VLSCCKRRARNSCFSFSACWRSRSDCGRRLPRPVSFQSQGLLLSDGLRLGLLRFLLLPGRLLGCLLGLKLAAFQLRPWRLQPDFGPFRLSARGLGFGTSASFRFRINTSLGGSFFRNFLFGRRLRLGFFFSFLV